MPPNGEHPAVSDPRLQGAVVAAVLGHRICKEVSKNAEGQVVVRFVATYDAAHHVCPHLRCRTRREMCRRHTAVYGDAEPLAYLGAWLQRGPELPGRMDHVQFCPTGKDVKRFVEAHGLPVFIM